MVIVPPLNAAEGVTGILDSIRNQGLTDGEIVEIVDRSADAGLDVVLRFADWAPQVVMSAARIDLGFCRVVDRPLPPNITLVYPDDPEAASPGLASGPVVLVKEGSFRSRS